MKVVTLFGTRPEIIRLSRVIPEIDRYATQVLVHTGQNHDPNLSDVFFRDLGVRMPDVHLGVRTESFAMQVSQILTGTEDVLSRERPDRLLVLGDTNSGLSALVAARMRVPVFHMEAGNRSYDDRIPEEINRRVIDHCSDVLMPYTFRSKDALVREGVDRTRIFVTGNPIFEVLQYYSAAIDGSGILSELGIADGKFLLATLHRAENVDDPERLKTFMEAFVRVTDRYGMPLIVSVHPRTADKLTRFGISAESKLIRLVQPLGFLDFVKLERTAFCVLSDSGTVQEECCIFGIPNVTLRDVTERPETIECGSNILSGSDPSAVERAVALAVDEPHWQAPQEYKVAAVSRTVVKIVLGYHERLDRDRE